MRKFLKACFQSYQSLSTEEEVMNGLTIPLGSRVCILRGDYPPAIKRYEGQYGVVIAYNNEKTDTPYMVRAESTGEELYWYQPSDLKIV